MSTAGQASERGTSIQGLGAVPRGRPLSLGPKVRVSWASTQHHPWGGSDTSYGPHRPARSLPSAVDPRPTHPLLPPQTRPRHLIVPERERPTANPQRPEAVLALTPASLGSLPSAEPSGPCSCRVLSEASLPAHVSWARKTCPGPGGGVHGGCLHVIMNQFPPSEPLSPCLSSGGAGLELRLPQRRLLGAEGGIWGITRLP